MPNLLITEYFILETLQLYLQPNEHTTNYWCDFKFSLTWCWNRVIEAENEQEIRYWARRSIEDVQLFLI